MEFDLSQATPEQIDAAIRQLREGKAALKKATVKRTRALIALDAKRERWLKYSAKRLQAIDDEIAAVEAATVTTTLPLDSAAV